MFSLKTIFRKLAKVRKIGDDNMEKINIEKLEALEYWVGNNFVENLKYEVIRQLKSNSGLLEEIKKNGIELNLSIGEKKSYIVNDLDDCFEYIQNFNDNGHEVRFDIDEIIKFTIENLAEVIDDFIKSDYKNEWEKIK